jgi:hypothetical protein
VKNPLDIPHVVGIAIETLYTASHENDPEPTFFIPVGAPNPGHGRLLSYSGACLLTSMVIVAELSLLAMTDVRSSSGVIVKLSRLARVVGTDRCVTGAIA